MRRRGFTLLEVMVAVAILGLSLTVILSAQVGLFSSGTYAQHMSEALGLGRCRMSELEEQFLKLGYPEVDMNDEGACCMGDLRQDIKCVWKVERIEMPNPLQMSFNGADGGVNPAGSTGGLSLDTPNSLGPLGALASAANGLPGASGSSDPSALGLPPGGLAGLASSLGAPPGGLSGGGTGALSGVLAAGAMGGTGALAPILMSIVYPNLKPMLEASIRKVTLKIQWREGMAQREIELVQWVSNPVKGGFIAGALGSGSGLPFPGMSPLNGLPPANGATPSIPGLGR